MGRRGEVLVLVAAALVAVGGAAPVHASGLDRDVVLSRADLAARHMANVQGPDGTFGYEYDFVLGKYLDRDNVVRQAGAAVGLAEYLNLSGKESFREPVERAMGALAARSIAYGDGLVVSGDGTLSGAATGASALALLAELHYFEQTGDHRFQPLRVAWLNGLRALQRATGGFAERPGSEAEADYYNGETWLALAHYARLFPNDRVAGDMVSAADAYLMDYYTQNPSLMFFHWGMRAASVRFETAAEARFLDFMSMQSWLFVHYMDPELFPERNGCSIVEGLASAARALRLGGRTADPVYASVLERAERELTNSLDMQIMPGQTRIALAEDRFFVDAKLAPFAGAFLNERYRPQTRIDATTHCLWALMKYGALKDAINAGD